MCIYLLRELVIISSTSKLIFKLCPLLMLFNLCTHGLSSFLVFCLHLFYLKLLHISLVFLRGEREGGREGGRGRKRERKKGSKGMKLRPNNVTLNKLNSRELTAISS